VRGAQLEAEVSDSNPVLPAALVVDDEPANLDTFRRVFRQQMKMRLCSAPREGLEVLKAGAFDVVIADHAMPEMTGVEFLAAAKELAPDSGRVIVTGYPDLAEVREAGRSGLAAAIIMKPWNREEVVRWAQHFQKVRRMRKALDSAQDTPNEPYDKKP
jgi:response regulator RpfG family c-di-GMP phosphodiesterase